MRSNLLVIFGLLVLAGTPLAVYATLATSDPAAAATAVALFLAGAR